MGATTEQERQRQAIIEYVGKTYKERVWAAHKPSTPADVSMCTTFYTWAQNGAALAIDRLSELRKPSENLVEQIEKVFYTYESQRWFSNTDEKRTGYIHSNRFAEAAQEIANLAPFNQNAELLEVLKTIENDKDQIPPWLWRRIKKAIQNAEK